MRRGLAVPILTAMHHRWRRRGQQFIAFPRSIVRLLLGVWAFAPPIGMGALPTCALLAPAEPCMAAADPAQSLYTPEHIDQAIKSAIQYVYSVQNDNGQWEDSPLRIGGDKDDIDWEHMQGNSWGGFTALSTYALLAAGESPNDPRIVKAIRFLEHANISGIYAIGLRAQVWTCLPNTDDVFIASRRDYQLLINAVNTRGNPGYYHYSIRPDGSFDRSVSQYGVLGVWACSQRVEVDPDYWRFVDRAWKRSQLSDGGWRYADDPRWQSTLAMTAAGVATLFITEDEITRGNACAGNGTNGNIEAGLNYIATNLKPDLNFYLWYGMERIGVASGLKFIGTQDWYDVGLHAILPHQDPQSGAFSGDGYQDVVDTDFALLFLSRGRAPVCMSKVQYSFAPPKSAAKPDAAAKVPATAQPDAAAKAQAAAQAAANEPRWNQRPRDLANFTRWFSKQTEEPYNWQSITLDVPVSDLHDAPILMLEGDQALDLPDDQVAKLKQFVQEGGMIVGNPDCGSAIFGTSFRRLGEKMFPYEFRELPAEHPIFTHEQYPAAGFGRAVQMMGMSNGVRELMVLLPADPSAYWAVNGAQLHRDAFESAADLYEYAVDLRPMYRDQTYLVTPDPAVTAKTTIAVARLQFDGNWDPEPYGWSRLAAILHNDYQLDVKTTPVKLGTGALNSSYAIADLTGTGPLRLTETQQSELALFVKGGGTLIVDAAGGDSSFADSAELALKDIFPIQASQLSAPLGFDSALYTMPAAKIKVVNYRRYARKLIEGDLHQPRVRGIIIDGRTAVFYSPEDLTAGLVGESVDGIIGYAPATATAIVRNIVLSVIAKSSTTAPATAPAATSAPAAGTAPAPKK